MLDDGRARQVSAIQPIKRERQMKLQRWGIAGSIGLAISLLAIPAFADGDVSACSGLSSQAKLQSALDNAVGVSGNGGLGFNMWATLVANDGTVCAVAFSGARYADQWLGSRIISAQKANTANDFSVSNGAPPGKSLFPTGLALSTANLYSAVQPGGSLYGLQHSNPVDATTAYQGNAMSFGTAHDPLVGNRIGGVNVFGGGLALYVKGGKKIGGVGVSGDTSCTDHMVAWRVRSTLGLDHLASLGHLAANPALFPDNIIFDITPIADGGLLNPNGTLSKSASGFGHPMCLNNPDLTTLPGVLP
jgi:hypothetical protein